MEQTESAQAHKSAQRKVYADELKNQTVNSFLFSTYNIQKNKLTASLIVWFYGPSDVTTPAFLISI